MDPTVGDMSVQEIERQIELLTPEDQARVESFVRLLRKVNSAEFRARIASAHAEFDAGRKITARELEASLPPLARPAT